MQHPNEITDWETIEDAPNEGLLVLNIFPTVLAGTQRFRSPHFQPRVDELLKGGLGVPHVIDVPMDKIEGQTPIKWNMMAIDSWVEWELNPFIKRNYLEERAICLVNFGGDSRQARHLAASLIRWQRTVVFLPK